jgi:hypothetical protein
VRRRNRLGFSLVMFVRNAKNSLVGRTLWNLLFPQLVLEAAGQFLLLGSQAGGARAHPHRETPHYQEQWGNQYCTKYRYVGNE